jgi:uncharacterized protein involved in outer membrane biogenesis
MPKKILRWIAGVFVALFLVAIIAVLSIDRIARTLAERRIELETGFHTSIKKFTIGLVSPTIHIENFVLKNPAQFGGDTFVEMPELYLEYDRAALRAGKLHLKVVRVNVAKVHIVENKDGKKNVDDLQKHQARSKTQNTPQSTRNVSTNKTEPTFVFDGIDTLDVSLNSVRFTSEKHPEQNLEQNLGIKHEMFKNLKTDLDFQTAEMVLVLKAGLSGALDLDAIFKSAKTGRKTKKVLEDVAEPLKLDPTKP